MHLTGASILKAVPPTDTHTLSQVHHCRLFCLVSDLNGRTAEPCAMMQIAKSFSINILLDLSIESRCRTNILREYFHCR